MAIVARITVNGVQILQLDADPTAGGGTAALSGSIGMHPGGKTWRKDSGAATLWTEMGADADLTGGTGLVVQTAADTYVARSITAADDGEVLKADSGDASGVSYGLSVNGLLWFGGGSDGALVCTTTSGAGSGPITTIIATHTYSSISVEAGATLVVAGTRTYCSGTCIIASGGRIVANGGDASAHVAGAAAASGMLGAAPANGGTGVNSGDGAEGADMGVNNKWWSRGFLPVGGNGGGAGGWAGGVGSSVGQHSAASGDMYDPISLQTGRCNGYTGNVVLGGGGGGSGASLPSTGTAVSGGGGGGGGRFVLMCKELDNSGTIEANGGDGGDASFTGAGSAGGGGGGGGGQVTIIAGRVVTTGTITATGGAKGTAANGASDGVAGDDGIAIVIDISDL